MITNSLRSGDLRAGKASAALVVLLTLLAACSGLPAGSTPTAPAHTPAPTPTASRTETPGYTFPDETFPDATFEAVDDGNGWPADVELVLAGTLTHSDGGYDATGEARLCGNASFWVTGNPRVFIFEFPLDYVNQEIIDITFTAQDLVAGAETGEFHAKATVRAKEGGQPPATVIRADTPGTGDGGTARYIESGGIRTLTVSGVNAVGESLTMTVRCGPPPPG